jgi:hypothetical protein
MQADDAMNDAALDRELEQAFAIEPSPDFAAKVRMRIASEPAPTVWRFSWVACSVGGAIVALIVIAAIAPWHTSSMRTAGVPSVGRTSTIESSELPKSASSLTRTDGPPSVARAEPLDHGRHNSRRPAAVTPVNVEARTREAGHDLEVLVDVRESNAITRLILAIRDGRVPVVQPDLAAPAESAALTRIVISPLTIDPIGLPDSPQGVRP